VVREVVREMLTVHQELQIKIQSFRKPFPVLPSHPATTT
jgi:hypothetical protein